MVTPIKLELVHAHISANTVEALLTLTEAASNGEYTGFVIGVLRPRNRFSVHCAGEACDRPAWSRTIVLSIDDELREMVRNRSFEETRS